MTLTSKRLKNNVRPSRILKKLFWGGIVLCGLGACSSPQKNPNETASSIQQKNVELKEVPFFTQHDLSHAPAALAMVLNHQGTKATLEQLTPFLQLQTPQGNLQTAIQAVPQQFGLLSYQMPPNTESVLEALNAAHPVLVLLNRAQHPAPQWEYAVVVGYSSKNDTMILRSGNQEREEMSINAFKSLWDQSKNWGMITLRPEAPIPAFVAPQAYLNALLSLEAVAPKSALQGYQRAIETWPKEAWFRFGGGNMYLADNQLPEAEQQLTQAVALYPDFADAWNNLAEVQLKQGRKPEARVSINKAIALGGVNAQTYQETAARIN